jgi:hypothetical protein
MMTTQTERRNRVTYQVVSKDHPERTGVFQHDPYRGLWVRERAGLVREDALGHYRADRAHLIQGYARPSPWQPQVLAWLRDHVNRKIPRLYYKAVLGHDLHVSTYGLLWARYFHAGRPDPFTGELTQRIVRYHADSLPQDGDFQEVRRFLSRQGDGFVEVLRAGWWEQIGLISEDKVTIAFRDFEVDQLQVETSVYGDYKFHRPGTSGAAEANTETALVIDAGLEATGTQTESAADKYRSVATVTADTTETWAEHSVRNATGAAGGTMMDRNLISPTVAVVNLDTVEFTFDLTKTAEA